MTGLPFDSEDTELHDAMQNAIKIAILDSDRRPLVHILEQQGIEQAVGLAEWIVRQASVTEHDAERRRHARWRDFLNWEPQDSDGEADWEQAASFDAVLDAIRTLPRQRAARLLGIVAQNAAEQATKAMEKPDGRGHRLNEMTWDQCADLLCDVKELGRKATAEKHKIKDAETVHTYAKRAKRRLGLKGGLK